MQFSLLCSFSFLSSDWLQHGICREGLFLTIGAVPCTRREGLQRNSWSGERCILNRTKKIRWWHFLGWIFLNWRPKGEIICIALPSAAVSRHSTFQALTEDYLSSMLCCGKTPALPAKKAETLLWKAVVGTLFSWADANPEGFLKHLLFSKGKKSFLNLNAIAFSCT